MTESSHPSCRLGASSSCTEWMEAQGCWNRPEPVASTNTSASVPWARSLCPAPKVHPLPPQHPKAYPLTKCTLMAPFSLVESPSPLLIPSWIPSYTESPFPSVPSNASLSPSF